MKPVTVGDVRKVLDGMEDDTPVLIGWAPGEIPSDREPAVMLCDIRRVHVCIGGGGFEPVDHPEVRVALRYLDELELEDEDDN